MIDENQGFFSFSQVCPECGGTGAPELAQQLRHLIRVVDLRWIGRNRVRIDAVGRHPPVAIEDFPALGRQLDRPELLPIGAPRRNWILTLVSDGFLVVRHPDLQATLDIADAVGTDLHLYAG